jgi:DNA polymerase-3 subunit delta
VLYVLYGPDQFRARDELQKIRRELDKDGNLGHNTVRIEGTEVRSLTPGDLRAAGHTASFFAEDRLVIVEGLLGKLSGARRRSGSATRRSRSSSDGAASELEQYLDVLNNLPETTTVVLIDENAPAAFLEGIEGKSRVKKFDILRGDQLRGWAAERVRAQGATFAAGALDRLVSLIDGNHLGELASEVDKLITYANGRTVEMHDVDDMVSGAVAYQTWDLTDAVIEGRTDRAMAVLRRMDSRDYPRQVLSYMLVRQYRQLMLAQALLKDGLGTPQIASHLGLQPGSFPLRKIIDQASRFPADRLEQAYKRLLENDVAVKTGALDADTSLEMLVVSLAELARGPRRATAQARR